jgi:hypothetical protein
MVDLSMVLCCLQARADLPVGLPGGGVYHSDSGSRGEDQVLTAGEGGC